MIYDQIDRLRYDTDLIRKVRILTQEQVDMLLKIYDKIIRILNGNKILLILVVALPLLLGPYRRWLAQVPRYPTTIILH